MRLHKPIKKALLHKLILIGLLCLALPQTLFAEETPAASAAKELKPEGGEGVPSVKLEDPHMKEWNEEEGRIQILKALLEKGKGEVEQLIAAKSTAADTSEVISIARDITKKTEEMKKNFAEYRKLQLHIRFKHPEKGDFTERKYEREDASLSPILDQDSQFDLSLQGKLDKIKLNFASHYNVEHKKSSFAETTAERKPAALDDPKRILLAK